MPWLPPSFHLDHWNYFPRHSVSILYLPLAPQGWVLMIDHPLCHFHGGSGRHSCWLVAQSCLTLLQPELQKPTSLLWQWDFPGKNTGVGCHSLLGWIFLTQGSNLLLRHCRQILYCWATREAQEYWSGYSPGDLPNPGIKLEPPALQVDSLPAELPGSPRTSLNRPPTFLWKTLSIHKSRKNIDSIYLYLCIT